MGSSVTPTSGSAANLVSTKFTKILADTGPQASSSGGSVRVGIASKIERIARSKKAVGSITYTAIAHPENVNDKEAFAFRIAVTVEGLFEWSDKEPDFKDHSVEYSLLQSLFVIATLEVVALAGKLGYNNLELPMDIKTAKAKAAKATTPSKSSTKNTSTKPATIRSRQNKK